MILVAQQPLYWPWLGLFDKLADADMFCLFDGVQFVPKSFQCRNKIRTKESWQWLTVPTLNSGHRDKRLCNIEINNSLPWRRKHLRSLEMNYGKAPYFDNYHPYLKWLYAQNWKYLVDINHEILRWSTEELGIDIQIVKATQYDWEGHKSELVLNMCKDLEATTYVYGPDCDAYLDKNEFKKAGIEPCVKIYNHPSYNQVQSGFESNMSIIDLLMNEGPSSLEILSSTHEQLNC